MAGRAPRSAERCGTGCDLVPPLPLPRPDRPDREGEEPQQVPRARQGRARFRGDQEHLRLPQGPLSRSGEEPAPAGGDRCAGQPLHRPITIAEGVGNVPLETGKSPKFDTEAVGSARRMRRFGAPKENIVPRSAIVTGFSDIP